MQKPPTQVVAKPATAAEKVEDLVNASSATSTPINCKSIANSVQNSSLKKRSNEHRLALVEPPVKRRKLSQDSDKSQKLDLEVESDPKRGGVPQSLNSSCTNS